MFISNVNRIDMFYNEKLLYQFTSESYNFSIVANPT